MYEMGGVLLIRTFPSLHDIIYNDDEGCEIGEKGLCIFSNQLPIMIR